MEKRQLGKTDLQITPVGLGVGGILGLKMFSEPKSLNIIQKSIDKGINFFDTGSSYSSGNAEIRLGKVLSKNQLDNLVIATKGGTVITKNNKLVKDYSRASLTRNLDISLKKLCVDKIDLFQLHSPSISHLTDDVYETLEQFRDSGKIRYFGISCDGLTLNHVIDVGFFDTVMCTYNILNQKPLSQIKLANKKNIGVLVKSAMAHSLYSNNIFKIKTLADLWYFLRVVKNYRPELIKGFKYRFINNIQGWSGSEIALKFVLENQYVDCAMIGTTKIEHLESNIAVLDKKLPNSIIQKIIEA